MNFHHPQISRLPQQRQTNIKTMQEENKNLDQKNQTLKERILAVLDAKSLSYSQLLDYIDLDEKQLDEKLDQHTIDIRTLELISKELRIPLYSFFSNPNAVNEDPENQFYNVNIWAPHEIQLQNENKNLREDVERLKLDLARKELFIQGLENQLKKEG